MNRKWIAFILAVVMLPLQTVHCESYISRYDFVVKLIKSSGLNVELYADDRYMFYDEKDGRRKLLSSAFDTLPKSSFKDVYLDYSSVNEADTAESEDAMRFALAEHLKIVSGSHGCFRPNEPITREEMAVITYRLMNCPLISYGEYYKDKLKKPLPLWGYTDGYSVSPYARDAFSCLLRMNLIRTKSGRLEPKAYVTAFEGELFTEKASIPPEYFQRDRKEDLFYVPCGESVRGENEYISRYDFVCELARLDNYKFSFTTEEYNKAPLSSFRDVPLGKNRYNFDISGTNSISYNKPARFVLITELGFAVGDTEGNFYPERKITREEAALLVYKSLLSKFDGDYAARVTNRGKIRGSIDVDKASAYAVNALNSLCAFKIIKVENGFINPKAPITTQEASNMITWAICLAQESRIAEGDYETRGPVHYAIKNGKVEKVK